MGCPVTWLGLWVFRCELLLLFLPSLLASKQQENFLCDQSKERLNGAPSEPDDRAHVATRSEEDTAPMADGRWPQPPGTGLSFPSLGTSPQVAGPAAARGRTVLGVRGSWEHERRFRAGPWAWPGWTCSLSPLPAAAPGSHPHPCHPRGHERRQMTVQLVCQAFSRTVCFLRKPYLHRCCLYLPLRRPVFFFVLFCFL